MQASHTGVTPLSVAALAFAPARSSAADGIGIVVVRGPMKRRRAVGLRRIHVDALLQERGDRRPVLAFYGVEQARIGVRRRGSDEAGADGDDDRS